MSESTQTATQPADRPNPGLYSPRQRLLRVLRHERVDRLPIVPTALTPFTWHAEYDVYRPVLELARRHCEFMASFGLSTGLALCDPAVLEMSTEKEEQGERKIRRTTLKTPRGDLTEVRVHDRSVGSWATSKFFVNSDDDLAAWESLPFRMVRPDPSDLPAFDAKIGLAGLPYLNGVSDALNLATGMMGEEYRIMFCFSQQDRLMQIVRRMQERLLEFLTHLLDELDRLPRGACDTPAGPVFRWYSIEPYVEPIQPPRFIDKFIVPFDREAVKLIHDRGRRVVAHCHGRLKAQISRMVQIGFDGVDCVESPPANDATLTEMLAAADGRLFLWGYIQFEDLAHKSGDEIEAMVRDAVAVGGTQGRYVLGQAASPWSADITLHTQANFIRMIQAGVKYGGH